MSFIQILRTQLIKIKWENIKRKSVGDGTTTPYNNSKCTNLQM